jgi:kynurenine formamidase
MKIIDLTHPIAPGISLFPGTPEPLLEERSTIERDGFREKRLCFYSHVGTHLDAAAHLLLRGKTLEEYPLEQFAGPAVAVDCRNGAIDRRLLEESSIGRGDIVLLCTGWSRFWGQDAYQKNYPCLSQQALEYLRQQGVKGVGMDTLGPDPVDSPDLWRHRQLLADGYCILLENLTNLEKLIGHRCFLTAFPLKLPNAEGAPARVVAFMED